MRLKTKDGRFGGEPAPAPQIQGAPETFYFFSHRPMLFDLDEQYNVV